MILFWVNENIKTVKRLKLVYNNLKKGYNLKNKKNEL